MSGEAHVPVLLEEALEYLDIQRSGSFIDCTIGLGGHSREILKRNPSARIIGFDIDETSLLTAKDNLGAYADRVELFHSDFRFIPDLNLDLTQVRGILIDLGISSYQLDMPDRGFSYSREGPLDMRMDLRNKTTAAKVINKYSENKLGKIFRKYGELRQANRLARAIASKRKTEKFETTSQLFKLVEDVCHWRHQKGKTHPAARVFQALRIEVNQELKDLAKFLERTIHTIPLGCRFVVISFHSLEDRIIKHTFAQLASPPDTKPIIKVLTKKPVRPSEAEVTQNFRARSAKLRAAERI